MFVLIFLEMRCIVSLVLSYLSLLSCTYHDLGPADCTLSEILLTVGAVTPAADCDAADGTISVSATGGEPPYTFMLNNGLSQTEAYFSGVPAGIYTITARDVRGCESHTDGVIVPASTLSFNVDLIENTGCLTGNGSFTIDIVNGNETYEFAFNNAPFDSNNSFSGLPHGVHQVSVKDTSECIFKLNVTVPRGISGVSWQHDILPIVKTKCADSGCHNGISRPDLRIYDKAKFYASSIKRFTQDKSMPFDGSLTAEQIQLIACWVDDGAPDN